MELVELKEPQGEMFPWRRRFHYALGHGVRTSYASDWMSASRARIPFLVRPPSRKGNQELGPLVGPYPRRLLVLGVAANRGKGPPGLSPPAG